MKGEGHKPFRVTDMNRAQVKALAAFGTPQEDIARMIGTSEPTLRKHFRHELDVAMAEANAKVASSLFKMATSGNVAAAIFWSKARMGWRETTRTEVTGENGGPVQLESTRERIISRIASIAGPTEPDDDPQ